MNTFLPYPQFTKSAECLDYRRLGKQRVETWQIYQCLTGQGSLRWKNHPAVKMWKGYELALLHYGCFMCWEWAYRGYKDTLFSKFSAELKKFNSSFFKIPTWLGNEKFHAAMRSNLLRKDKKFYSQYGWTEPDNLPYTWGEV